jgi:hypothetical protein
MLLVIMMLHLAVPPPPLLEALHCVTDVTRLPEDVGAPPFRMTTEPVVAGLLVRSLTIVTLHAVVTPPPSLMPLHWLIARGAADTESEPAKNSTTSPPKASASTPPNVSNLRPGRIAESPVISQKRIIFPDVGAG